MRENEKQQFIDILINFRFQYSMTQEFLSNELSIHPSTLCRWEKGILIPKKVQKEQVINYMRKFRGYD